MRHSLKVHIMIEDLAKIMNLLDVLLSLIRFMALNIDRMYHDIGPPESRHDMPES
jgi:hypothetical protein